MTRLELGEAVRVCYRKFRRIIVRLGKIQQLSRRTDQSIGQSTCGDTDTHRTTHKHKSALRIVFPILSHLFVMLRRLGERQGPRRVRHNFLPLRAPIKGVKGKRVAIFRR